MPAQLGRLAQPVELVLFRALQEGLTNIYRHPGSKIASIRLRVENGGVNLAVEDRAKGFASVDGQPARAGVGIASMRERVRELGGGLRVSSGAAGTTVEAVMPLKKEIWCRSVSS
jgi:two-component system NarL family sensor kinase